MFPRDNSRLVWIDEKKLGRLPKEMRRLYLDFAVIDKKGGKYGCPVHFNDMTVAWFLNEPRKGARPNVRCDEKYDFYALRAIRAGEELTVDYKSFSD